MEMLNHYYSLMMELDCNGRVQLKTFLRRARDYDAARSKTSAGTVSAMGIIRSLKSRADRN